MARTPSVRQQAAQVRVAAVNFWASLVKRPSSHDGADNNPLTASQTKAASGEEERDSEEEASSSSPEESEAGGASSSSLKESQMQNFPQNDAARPAGSSEATCQYVAGDASPGQQGGDLGQQRSLQSLIAGRLEEARRSSSQTLSSWGESLRSISLARKQQRPAENEDAAAVVAGEGIDTAGCAEGSSSREGSDSRQSSAPREAIDVVLRQQLLSAEEAAAAGGIDLCCTRAILTPDAAAAAGAESPPCAPKVQARFQTLSQNSGSGGLCEAEAIRATALKVLTRVFGVRRTQGFFAIGESDSEGEESKCCRCALQSLPRNNALGFGTGDRFLPTFDFFFAAPAETNSPGGRVEVVGEAQDIISLMRQFQNFIEVRRESAGTCTR